MTRIISKKTTYQLLTKYQAGYNWLWEDNTTDLPLPRKTAITKYVFV